LKKIRILTVSFDTEITSFEIPAFRGAVIQKVGTDNVAFHNHLKGNTFLYRYPLIQYKQVGRKPCIMCVEHGVDEIHKFFEKKDWDLNRSNRRLEMTISRLNLNQYTMQVWDKMFDYSIQNWIALNSDNYRKFQNMESLSERVTFLENTLKANILSFAKGIEWTVDKEIKVSINEIIRQRKAKVKGSLLSGFDVMFRTNVFIPPNLGLGKSVSMGYGVVRSLKNLHRNNENS
jgi:hypothetical protein